MSKKITVSATPEGFAEAAKWLEDYKKQMLKNVSDLVGKMLREGEVTARVFLTHFDTGETHASILGYREGNHGMIVAGGNAIWIEFGTGVYAPGQADHPLLGQLDGIVAHGQYGKGHGADPNGWYYPLFEGDPDTPWRHTYGIPANMFMYNTAQMLRKEYKRMAKEIFK